MEDTRNRDGIPAENQSNTFKQHYAGTSVAKQYDKYNHPISKFDEGINPERESLPMELNAILEWARKPENHTYVTTGCAALAVAITAIYTGFAVLQWFAMRESNQINRDALVSVQRAFVTFSPAINIDVRIDPITHRANSWNFMTPMENSGTTPTRGMTIHANQTSSHDPLPDNFTYPDIGDLRPQLVVLGPKQTANAGAVSVSPDVIEAVENAERGEGVWHLYLYGWAKYYDIFENTPLHITEFCYELTQVSGAPWAPKQADLPTYHTYWTACPHHNCTDDDCKIEP